MIAMELTKTDIREIISSGIIEHSSEAEKYIKEAKKQFGIDIVACYCDTHQMLNFSKKSGIFLPPKIFGKYNPKDSFLVNHLLLTVYLRGKRQDADVLRGKYGDELLKLLQNIIPPSKAKAEYKRTFTSEEMQYYGWLNKKRSEWDMSKIIYPEKPAADENEISIESFDDLVMWNYLSEGMRVINSFQSAKELSAKTFCGWDSKTQRQTLYIILPEEKFIDADKQQQERLNSEILAYMHSVDKFGVVRDDEFMPIYTVWSALS